jgi:molybdopterin-guanine dinucleotide biosynthesis protein A
MGQDKGLLPFRGGTLVEAVARAVEAAAGPPALVGGGPHYGNLGYRILPDLHPGAGPLGGILSALQNSTADWNLIVACDMPGLTPEFLRKLMDTAEASGGDALVPASPRGPEPLCAVYHRRARPPLHAAFERGVRQIAAALEEVRTVHFPVPELSPFQNVNTPEEWAPYAR